MSEHEAELRIEEILGDAFSEAVVGSIKQRAAMHLMDERWAREETVVVEIPVESPKVDMRKVLAKKEAALQTLFDESAKSFGQGDWLVGHVLLMEATNLATIVHAEFNMPGYDVEYRERFYRRANMNLGKQIPSE